MALMRKLFLVAMVAAAQCAANLAWAQPRQERESASAASQLSEVGKGSRMGRKELQPGAFIGPRHRPRVHAWISRHRGGAKPAPWRIGESLPAGAATGTPPRTLLGVLPPTPPGMRYVLLGDALLLTASSSRMVVDAVSLSGPGAPPR